MTSFALYMAANLYDTLVRADVDFNLAPALATEWSSSADAKTWTFKLRDGVTFHSGKKMTSADVAYSVSRILNAKLASPVLSNISPFLKPDGISTPDSKTVQFQLSAANAFFPQILARRELRRHPGRHRQLREGPAPDRSRCRSSRRSRTPSSPVIRTTGAAGCPTWTASTW